MQKHHSVKSTRRSLRPELLRRLVKGGRDIGSVIDPFGEAEPDPMELDSGPVINPLG